MLLLVLCPSTLGIKFDAYTGRTDKAQFQYQRFSNSASERKKDCSKLAQLNPTFFLIPSASTGLNLFYMA